ncbi:MAG: hypothetical protein HUJ51_06655 [Eggerthellaceae bacterium]|nr:hypothetical protein [Eggerthellaceae bacterium]
MPCPLTEETREFVKAESIAQMKGWNKIVTTSRGRL